MARATSNGWTGALAALAGAARATLLLLLASAQLGCRPNIISVYRAPPTEDGRLGVPMKGVLARPPPNTSDSGAFLSAFNYGIPSPGTLTITMAWSPAQAPLDIFVVRDGELLASTREAPEKKIVLQLEQATDLYVLVEEDWSGGLNVRFQLTASLAP